MTQRSRRSGVEDRWHKTAYDADKKPQTVRTAAYGKGARWRARYVDSQGQEHSQRFGRKPDAQAWLDKQIAALESGSHVAPRNSRLTVEQWCDEWLEGYARNRPSSVRCARKHITHIKAGFGKKQLQAVDTIDVQRWVAGLKTQGLSVSYTAAIHDRLAQILGDAVLSRRLGRNPCVKTAPESPGQREYFPTTDEVWQLHDGIAEHLRVGVLLAAFVGLRLNEAAGLLVADVDFMKGSVYPKRQWDGSKLKTDGSKKAVPIPQELAFALSESVRRWPGEYVVTDGYGRGAGPDRLSEAVREARVALKLPDGLNYHALRHHYASMLIAQGASVLEVCAAMRHKRPSITLDTYSHLFPTAEATVRAAVSRGFVRSPAAPLRTLDADGAG